MGKASPSKSPLLPTEVAHIQIQPRNITKVPPLMVDIPNSLDITTREATQGMEVILSRGEEATTTIMGAMVVMEAMVGMVVMEVTQVGTSTITQTAES